MGQADFEARTRASARRCAWMVVALLAGAAASCGVQGSSGPSPGAAGATAQAGTTGSGAGSPGASGDTGAAAGASGAAGSTGAVGGAGGGGATGGAGTLGGAGSTGASGATGTAGLSGMSGTTGAAGAPLSGVTIKIGGVDVPKENAIAFIHFGHSNMAGRGLNPTATRPYFFDQTDPHAWTYHSASLAPFANGAKAGFELAIEPKTAGDKSNSRTGTMAGGLGTALVKEAVAKGAPGKYFISVGFGIASAYCSQFLPGALYYNNVIAAAKELKGKVTFAGIVILLGITERHGTTADIQNFPTCINKMATAIRNDLGEPNLPVLLNGYEMGATGQLAPTQPFAQTIIPRIAAVPAMVSSSAVIPLDNPLVQIEMNEMFEPNGDHHFTLDGHKEYARRVVQTMKDKGWWHW
jgi:hypothetical protein